MDGSSSGCTYVVGLWAHHFYVSHEVFQKLLSCDQLFALVSRFYEGLALFVILALHYSGSVLHLRIYFMPAEFLGDVRLYGYSLQLSGAYQAGKAFSKLKLITLFAKAPGNDQNRMPQKCQIG